MCWCLCGHHFTLAQMAWYGWEEGNGPYTCPLCAQAGVPTAIDDESIEHCKEKGVPEKELLTMVRRARMWARDGSTAWSTEGSAAPEQLRASATLLLAATGGVEPAPKPKPAELEAAITRAYAAVLELGLAYEELKVKVAKRVEIAPAPLKTLMAAVEAPPRVMGLAHYPVDEEGGVPADPVDSTARSMRAEMAWLGVRAGSAAETERRRKRVKLVDLVPTVLDPACGGPFHLIEKGALLECARDALFVYAHACARAVLAVSAVGGAEVLVLGGRAAVFAKDAMMREEYKVRAHYVPHPHFHLAFARHLPFGPPRDRVMRSIAVRARMRILICTWSNDASEAYTQLSEIAARLSGRYFVQRRGGAVDRRRAAVRQPAFDAERRRRFPPKGNLDPLIRRMMRSVTTWERRAAAAAAAARQGERAPASGADEAARAASRVVEPASADEEARAASGVLDDDEMEALDLDELAACLDELGTDDDDEEEEAASDADEEEDEEEYAKVARAAAGLAGGGPLSRAERAAAVARMSRLRRRGPRTAPRPSSRPAADALASALGSVRIGRRRARDGEGDARRPSAIQRTASGEGGLQGGGLARTASGRALERTSSGGGGVHTAARAAARAAAGGGTASGGEGGVHVGGGLARTASGGRAALARTASGEGGVHVGGGLARTASGGRAALARTASGEGGVLVGGGLARTASGGRAVLARTASGAGGVHVGGLARTSSGGGGVHTAARAAVRAAGDSGDSGDSGPKRAGERARWPAPDGGAPSAVRRFNKEVGKDLLTFEQARNVVRKLNLKNRREWRTWSKTKRPENIPPNPDNTYAGHGWLSWADFFGPSWAGQTSVRNGRVKKNFLSFEQARKVVRKLNLKDQDAWFRWSKAKRPENIPSNPWNTYAGRGWLSLPDFLGTKEGRPPQGTDGYFRTFEQAREFARGLNLKNQYEYRAMKHPDDIPKKPEFKYKHSGWKGWADFLGHA